MGKLLYGLIMIFVMEVAFLMIVGPSYNGQASTTSLTSFMMNIFDWDSNPFFAALAYVLGAAAVGGFVLGLIFQRTEWVLYAALAGTFFSFGLVILQYWTFIYQQDFLGDAASTLATLICGPLIIFFLFCTLDFGRGNG